MKRQDYRTRVAKTLNFEEHIFSEFEELCKEENVYPSHKLQQLMIGALEKKVVGQNPLNVSYGKQTEKVSLTDAHPLQTLDAFIETGRFTVTQWDVIAKETQDAKQCERYQNLAACIQSSFRKQSHFLKTGKRLVTSGYDMNIPSGSNS